MRYLGELRFFLCRDTLSVDTFPSSSSLRDTRADYFRGETLLKMPSITGKNAKKELPLRDPDYHLPPCSTRWHLSHEENLKESVMVYDIDVEDTILDMIQFTIFLRYFLGYFSPLAQDVRRYICHTHPSTVSTRAPNQMV